MNLTNFEEENTSRIQKSKIKMQNDNLKYKIIFLLFTRLSIFIVSIYFFYKETSYIVKQDFGKIPLDDNFMIFYLRMLFNFVAVPLFFLSKFFEYSGFLSSDTIEHYHIKLFYNSVYIILTIYVFSVFIIQ